MDFELFLRFFSIKHFFLRKHFQEITDMVENQDQNKVHFYSEI